MDIIMNARAIEMDALMINCTCMPASWDVEVGIVSSIINFAICDHDE